MKFSWLNVASVLMALLSGPPVVISVWFVAALAAETGFVVCNWAERATGTIASAGCATLRSTADFWQTWASTARTTEPYSKIVVRSLITLKALTYAPHGGIIAAPTTSLPERYVDAAVVDECRIL
jgi:GH15 family glucan-1,4-alpha-glucosidase